MRPTTVLATITGRDRPGVTAAFFAALAAHDVEIRDVEQVVIRGRLQLAVLFDLRGDAGSLRASVTSTAVALRMQSDVTVVEDAAPARRDRRVFRSHVTVLGCPLRPGALSALAQRIGDLGAGIESVLQLSTEPAASVEMLVRTTDPAALRAGLCRAAPDAGVDLAMEAAGLLRRPKRLAIFDLDGTLLREAGLDLLAQRAGAHERFVELQEQARTGQLDPGSAVEGQLALLAGLPERDLYAVCERVRALRGAASFIAVLRRLGFAVGVVSDGPRILADRFRREFDLDFAAGCDLAVRDGALTGRPGGPVPTGAGKAEALRRFAAERGVPLSQTVAAGRALPDLDLIGAAGLGIAFSGQSAGRLEKVLCLLGIAGDDLDSI
jgi:phosphoserine phosphatase